MLGLGRDVLKKIQNLLVQIDKSEDHRKTRQQILNIQDQGKRKLKSDNNKKNAKQYFQPKQFEKTNKQNIITQRMQQLYLYHFVKQKRIAEKHVQVFEKQLKSMKPFKVDNKVTSFLNKKQNLKPIYERAGQIILKKERSIENIRQHTPKTKQELQEEQMELILQQRNKRHKRLTKQQFKARMQEIEAKKIARIQKLNKAKLQQMQQRTQQILEKPKFTEYSRHWWQKKKLKRNLSSNVLERFKQYDYERKQKWQKYMAQRKNQQTPFTPRLSKVSRQIALRSKSKRSLLQGISRSHSCRTLSNHEDIQIDKKEDSFGDRVQDKKSHMKSTTINSSRHHMMSSQNRMSNERKLYS